MPATFRVVTALLLLTVCATARAGLVWHWEDRFSDAEKDKLTRWVSGAFDVAEQHVAPYPFDIHIHFHRAGWSFKPVPWAKTLRWNGQGIEIHVRPGTSRAGLEQDWTVYHELSHLFLPFLGNRNAWFAEGFASFMQYQLMQAAGVLTPEAMRARYRGKIEKAARRYDMPDRSFPDAAGILRSRREFPTMYWGGAVYFLNVDRQLRENGTSVPRVVREFVECCRVQRQGLDKLVATLDRIAGTDAFRSNLDALRQGSGFPDYSGLW